MYAKTQKSTTCMSMLHTKLSESTTCMYMLHANTPEFTPCTSMLHAETPESTIYKPMLHTKSSESTTCMFMLHVEVPESTICISMVHANIPKSTTCTSVLHARTTKSPSANLCISLTCYSLNCKMEHPDHQHLYLYRSIPYHFSLLPFPSLLFLPFSRLVWNFDIEFCYILMQFCNKVQENFTLDLQNWGYRVNSRVCPLCLSAPMSIPILNFIFSHIIQLLGK